MPLPVSGYGRGGGASGAPPSGLPTAGAISDLVPANTRPVLMSPGAVLNGTSHNFGTAILGAIPQAGQSALNLGSPPVQAAPWNFTAGDLAKFAADGRIIDSGTSAAAIAVPAAGLVASDGTKLIAATVGNGLNYSGSTLSTKSRILFAQTVPVTVANSAVETTLVGTGIGSLVLPANLLAVGTVLRITAFGFHSASGNPSIDIKAKLGATIVLDTGVVTSGNSTNALWDARAQIVCAVAGAGGNVLAQGFYTESAGGTNLFGMVNTAAVNINTTASLTLDFTAQWGVAAAGNTITMTNFALEVLNP